MRVLSLDLASRTGWAVDRDGGGSPHTGTYTLYASGTTRGPAFLKFNEWLYAFARQVDAEMLAYEAPIIGGAPMGVHEAMLLIGLAAQVEMIAAALKLPQPFSKPPQSVRKGFLGHGRPEDPKRKTLALCAALGWPTGGDHNRADAAALWYVAKSAHDRQFSDEMSPLFAAERAARMVGS